LALHLKMCGLELEITIILLWGENHLLYLVEKIFTENFPHRYI